MTKGQHTAERAKFWGVSLRTMQKMLAENPAWPVDDAEAMVRRFYALPSASQAKFTRGFRRRVDEVRLERERAGGDLFITDPDYRAFEKAHAAAESRESDTLADLKRQRDYAIFKLQRAQARGDLPAVKDSTESLRYIAGVIHDEELRAQKLNREIGDTIPRAEAERVSRAIGYWLVRGCDDFLAATTKRIAAASASGPLFPEEVRHIIEPELLGTRLLAPLARAAHVSAGATLPRWFVDALRAGVTATLDNGAAEFDLLYSAPIAAPPAPPTAAPAP
jgi:hypothetical protein